MPSFYLLSSDHPWSSAKRQYNSMHVSRESTFSILLANI